MDQQNPAHRVSPASKRLKAATADLHERSENRLDAVSRLSNDFRRADFVRRHAWLHIPAEHILAGEPWRTSLSVLERQVGDDHTRRTDASCGAGRAFQQAEAILCGDVV